MASENVLPEFIRIVVPQEEKDETPIAGSRIERWVKVFCGLVSSKPFRLGYEKLAASKGGWPRGKYDPATGEWEFAEAVMEETTRSIKVFCGARQFASLRARVVALLVEMGQDLNQDSVAYETRKGLHTIKIRRS
ncbi:MAG: hypothetical protein A3F84_10955 [Candidatus Handelsmanbacteria bacterium RIFCSPLOWO2_12_FULL_64_10]|uniref:Uncharacterized protein n=1 Tax=Handelsmanbacteria sp. (strain RIFCSPLOWO2_12_FULL_64_10) TaxID=1817868 RepID=A0A1F6C5M1_HANXR|nr:MAG: hypothetical protein A3F84_10955 [Candidatus Handelsmanbacteria bacterium RIFCSPLOWO2_12_FULL_64_10]